MRKHPTILLPLAIRQAVTLIPPLIVEHQPPPASTHPPAAEQWRPVVVAHFPTETVDAALSVLYCESRGNPNAQHPTSGAAGLFQAMPQWFTGAGWDRPSPYGPFDPFDPHANTRFAAWLSNGGSSWAHWVCKP